MDNLEHTQEYVDFFKTNLEPLAEHLKVSVEWLWGILVKQALVESIVYTIVISIQIFSLIIVTRVLFKVLKKAQFGDGIHKSYYVNKKTKEIKQSRPYDYPLGKEWDREYKAYHTNREGYISIVFGIFTVFSIIGLIVTMNNLPNVVTGYVNPEYRAIENIIEVARTRINKE